jgi:hypothetical protein
MQPPLIAADRLLLALVFGVAVVGKLRTRRAFTEFTDSLKGLVFVSDAAGFPVAVAIAGLETISVVALAINDTVQAGFALSAITLGALTAGIGVALLSQSQIECRCFGADGGTLSVRHLTRNALLLALAIGGFASSVAWSGRGDAPQHAVLAAAAVGVLLGALIVRWDDLAFLVLGDPVSKRIRVSTGNK